MAQINHSQEARMRRRKQRKRQKKLLYNKIKQAEIPTRLPKYLGLSKTGLSGFSTLRAAAVLRNSLGEFFLRVKKTSIVLLLLPAVSLQSHLTRCPYIKATSLTNSAQDNQYLLQSSDTRNNQNTGLGLRSEATTIKTRITTIHMMNIMKKWRISKIKMWSPVRSSQKPIY